MKNLFVLIMLLASIMFVACSQTDNTLIDLEQPTRALRIVLAVTDLSIGYNRLTFAVIDSKTGPVTRASLQAHTFLEGKDINDRPKKDLDIVYREWPDSKGGIYSTTAHFDESGTWSIEMTMKESDGKKRLARTSFTVKEDSATPPVGSLAPPSETKTALYGQDFPNVTSSTNPHAPLYKLSLKQALNTGKPTVVVFATPAFCRTSTCGPQVDVIVTLEKELGDNVNFIHVEIYDNFHDLQGSLKNAIVSPSVEEWTLPSEPWTFIMTSSGVISSKFEGFTTYVELREAIVALD